MGGVGAAAAHARRATEDRRSAFDKANLEKLRLWKEGARSKMRKSDAHVRVAEYRASAEPTASATAPGPVKRKLNSPHKSASRRGVGRGGDGLPRPTTKGHSLEIELTPPSNGLQYTPGSAVKILQGFKKPGKAANAMIESKTVPVTYGALLKMRTKANENEHYIPP